MLVDTVGKTDAEILAEMKHLLETNELVATAFHDLLGQVVVMRWRGNDAVIPYLDRVYLTFAKGNSEGGAQDFASAVVDALNQTAV